MKKFYIMKSAGLTYLKTSITTILMFIAISNTYAVDLVSYNLFTTYSSTSGIAANHPGGSISTTAASPSFISSSYLQTQGWDSGTPGGYKAYTTTTFSTFGYINVVVNASLWSQSTGPKNFAVEYKIGAGGTWTLANNITVGTTQRNYAVTLPTECINQNSVYVRWIATSYTTSSTAKNYINNVSIVGDFPSIPDTQASYVSFVSITPTTITTSCTPGNGDRRIIVMNTTNSFTDPVNDYYPTANSTYTSGEQVVYNGAGSSVTVTVPSSRNIYYFRVYDFKYNNGVTRYVTPTANNNPNQCALETIDANAATNIRLISVTLGATISTPTRSTIFDRGIVWSTNPGVLETDNPASEGGTSGGSFSLNFPDNGNGFPEMPRGTTIYYKGYVTNVSGTIYSNELSFTNIPIFTGTGNWETAGLWNVQEVPGTNGSVNGSIDDNPIINGTCTMTASHACTDLTINSGKKLTIQTATKLSIAGTLSNNAGTNGLLLKASGSSANASLIFDIPGNNSNVPASVEMYSKAYTDTKYHWQYFGIPVQTTLVGTTFYNAGHRVRKYDESNIDPTGKDVGLWKPVGVGATMGGAESLTAVDGYEVVQPSATTYTFKGNLNTQDVSKQLVYTNGADWAGNFIIGNPYTGAINIADINFGTLESAAYIYNTGSREEWINNSGLQTPGSMPGTYAVSTGGFAGIFGVPAQIPSMQGFLVKGNATSTISIPYSAVVQNNVQQRVKATSAQVYPATRIDVTGINSSDRMWIFSDNKFSSRFDNGWDGRKLLIDGNTQLYGIGEDGVYQINAVNDINETVLGFTPSQDGQYKLIFNHQNQTQQYGNLFLYDTKTDQQVNISENGTEYLFSATTKDTPARFRITSLTTNSTSPKANDVQIISKGKEKFICNNTEATQSITILSSSGKYVMDLTINSGQHLSVSAIGLNKGLYLVKIGEGGTNVKKIAVY